MNDENRINGKIHKRILKKTVPNMWVLIHFLYGAD